MLEDHGFDKIIDLWLSSNSVISIHPPQQARAKANSQVVGLHHVFVAVLRHTGRTNPQNELLFLAWVLSFVTIEDISSDRISHTGLCCSLLIEESEKVAQHNEERPWEGGDNRFNLGSSFCHPLDFWSWQRKGKIWVKAKTTNTVLYSVLFGTVTVSPFLQQLQLLFQRVGMLC